VTAREILAEFPAGGPRGSRPAEKKAQEFRNAGTPAEVRMDLPNDLFIVVPEGER
jgi:hypothetical protein